MTGTTWARILRSDVLPDLVPFVQFKKREKHSFTRFEPVTLLKSNTAPWIFFRFLKLYKWHQIAQRIT